MATIQIAVQHDPNIELLTQQLQAAMPNCAGIGYGMGSLIVQVAFNTDTVSDADIATAQAICLAHDPTQKTVAQQQAATVDAAAAHMVSTLLPAMGTLAAYYQSLTLTSPDVVSGAAQMKLFNDFATLLTGLKAWITANN